MMRNVVRVLACLAILVSFGGHLAAQSSVEAIINDIQSGKIDSATKRLDQELQIAPNWAYGHFLLGVCMMQKGLPDQAIERFQSARELEPTLFVAFYQEAQIRVQQGKYAEAVNVLNMGVPSAAPNEKPLGLQLRGQACARAGDYDCTIRDLKSSAGQDCPSNYWLGYAHYGKGDWKSASSALKKAASVCKGDTKVEAQDLLSKAYLNQGKAGYCDAMKAAKSALDAGSGSWKTYGEAALGCKKFAEAEKAFNKVLAGSPTDCNAIMNLGQALLGAKKYAQAEVKLGKAAGCLKGKARTNALVQKGFAQLGSARDKAKKYEGNVAQCDVDTSGRKKVIAVYENVRGTFEQAGSKKQVEIVNETIKSLQEQISGIEANVKIREENEKTRQQQLKIWAVEIDQDKKKDGDRDGVPDEEDKCEGKGIAGEVDLKGCPYKPPCT